MLSSNYIGFVYACHGGGLLLRQLMADTSAKRIGSLAVKSDLSFKSTTHRGILSQTQEENILAAAVIGQRGKCG